MFGIWDQEQQDWVREPSSTVDDGGLAILAFQTKREACRRAAKHFGFASYNEARRLEWCVVIPLYD